LLIAYEFLIVDGRVAPFERSFVIHRGAKILHHFTFCNNFVEMYYSEIIIGT